MPAVLPPNCSAAEAGMPHGAMLLSPLASDLGTEPQSQGYGTVQVLRKRPFLSSFSLFHIFLSNTVTWA